MILKIKVIILLMEILLMLDAIILKMEVYLIDIKENQDLFTLGQLFMILKLKLL